MRVRIHEYHPSNPKIDLYVNGKYRYSTNRFSRCYDARNWFLANHATSFERMASCSLKSYIVARKSTPAVRILPRVSHNVPQNPR